MSGGGVQSLYNILFGLFAVSIGLLQLLDPAVATRDEARARDWQLRYGNGGTDLRRVQASPRWPGFVFIAIGALHLLVPGFGGRPWPLLYILMGGFLLAIGPWILLIGPRLEASRLRRHEARLAAAARDADARPDELRALLANPPFSQGPLRRRLLVAAFSFLFGGAFLALGLVGAGR